MQEISQASMTEVVALVRAGQRRGFILGVLVTAGIYTFLKRNSQDLHRL